MTRQKCILVLGAFLIALLFFISFLFLPLSKKSEPITIVVQMFEGPESEAMIPTVRYWNQRYALKTGIVVKSVALDRVSYFEKLEMQFLSGAETPDIVHPFSIHLGRMSAFLEPLDSFLEDDGVMIAPNGEHLFLDALLPKARKTVEHSDGKTYMLPVDMSSVFLYYRKDLIAKPPETWDEFIAVAKQFTRSHNPQSPTMYGVMLQGKYEIWTFCSALEQLWSNGVNMLKPKTQEISLKSEDVLKGFRILENLSTSGVFPPETGNAEHPQVGTLLQTGNVAMALHWSAFYQDLVDPEKSPLVFDKFDIAPPPGVRDSEGRLNRAMYVQTICLGINKRSRYKKAAARFLTWVALGEGSEIYAKGEGDLPGGSAPTHRVWRDDHISAMYPRIYPWVEDFGRFVSSHRDMPKIMLIGANWTQKVILGVVTAEEAAQSFREEVKRYLNSRVSR